MPKKSGGKKKRFALRLRSYSAGLLGFIGLVALLENTVGESSWPTMLLLYLPPTLAMLFVVGGLAASVFERELLPFCMNSASLALLLWLDGLQVRSPASGLVDSNGGLTILTFNIQRGIGRPVHVGEAITKTQPDLIALQEARPSDLSSERGKPIAAAMKGFHQRMEHGLVIASRWPIRRSWTPSFQVPTHAWALFAEIEPDTGKPFVFASIHMNPVQWDRFVPFDLSSLPRHFRSTARIRERQVEALLKELDAIPVGTPVILCGDFNGPPRGKVYAALRERLEDAFALAGSGMGWTIPNEIPVFRYDHVFFRRGQRVVSAEVMEDSGSDHRPVLVRAAF